MMKKINLFLLLILLCFSCQKKYNKKIVYKSVDYYLHDYAKTSGTQAKEFIELLQKKYKFYIDSLNIDERFKDSLFFYNNQNFSVDYYFSTTRESALNFYRSNENSINIYGSDFPVQYFLIQNPNYRIFDIYNLDTRKGYTTEEFIKKYDKLYAAISVSSASSYWNFKGITFGTPEKMYRGLEENDFIFIDDIHISSYDIDNKPLKKVIFENSYKGILFGTRILANHHDIAKKMGYSFAINDIQTLYINSEFFREVKAINLLNPIAEEIIVKQREARQNPNFTYTLADFNNDRKKLDHLIDSFNVKFKAEDVLDDINKKVKSGTLFLFYSSFKGFSFQWFFFNVLFIIVAYFLAFTSFYNLVILEKKMTPYFIAAVFLSVNLWIFKQIPNGMPWYHWYPFILFFVLVFVLYNIEKLVPKRFLKKRNIL